MWENNISCWVIRGQIVVVRFSNSSNWLNDHGLWNSDWNRFGIIFVLVSKLAASASASALFAYILRPSTNPNSFTCVLKDKYKCMIKSILRYIYKYSLHKSYYVPWLAPFSFPNPPTSPRKENDSIYNIIVRQRQLIIISFNIFYIFVRLFVSIILSLKLFNNILFS